MGTVATMRKRGIIIDINYSLIKYLSWNILSEYYDLESTVVLLTFPQ